MSTTTLPGSVSSVKVSPHVSQAEILAAVAAGTMTIEKAGELLASTKKAPVYSPLRLTVSEKGCVSLYGLNSPQFPTTLYAAQWERLATFIPDVLAFIAEWEGKPYSGKAGKDKHAYTAVIARRNGSAS